MCAMGCRIFQVLLLCDVSHCSEDRNKYIVVQKYTGDRCAFVCSPAVYTAKKGMVMCARTCLFLWLLIAPLELLPPAGQVPLRLDGLALGGRRRFGPASDGLRSGRTAGSHGRGRVVWWDALCGGRLQHQASRCGVSAEVYAMRKQAGGGDAGRSSVDDCGATSNSCRLQRVSTMRRRRSCRPLCGRRVARGGARHSYNGAASRLFGELVRTHRAHGERKRDRQLVARSTIADLADHEGTRSCGTAETLRCRAAAASAAERTGGGGGGEVAASKVIRVSGRSRAAVVTGRKGYGGATV